MNLETIIDMQSWCRTWPPNGSIRVRAKQKLLRKHKGTCKTSWSRIGSRKSFTLTIPWDLASIVKIYPGNFVCQRRTDQKQMRLLKEQCEECKKGHLLQSGLDEKWWTDSMECCCYLRSILDLLSDGKTTCEGRFGMPFNGPVIPSEQWSKITLFLIKTYRDCIKSVLKSCQVYSLDVCCPCGDRSMHRKWLTPMKVETCMFLIADGTVKISGGDQVLRTTTFIRDSPDRGEEQGNLQGESDGLSTPTPHEDDSRRLCYDPSLH